MAKPPSDAPVLFDVECDSSTIKQGKDGSYKLVMEDVERAHWETAECEPDINYRNTVTSTNDWGDEIIDISKFVNPKIVDYEMHLSANLLLTWGVPATLTGFLQYEDKSGNIETVDGTVATVRPEVGPVEGKGPGGRLLTPAHKSVSANELSIPEGSKNIGIRAYGSSHNSAGDINTSFKIIETGCSGSEGYINAKKYTRSFATYYGEDAEVSAYETFTLADGSKEKCKFTITDVKYNEESNKLVYDITPKNKKQADKITGIESETQSESAVYSTERTRWRPDWMPNGRRRNLNGADLSGADLRVADLRDTTWFETICPNGIAAYGSSPCSGDQLIPLA